MFRLAPVATMKRTVTVHAPDPDKVDGVIEQKFTVHYRVLSKAETLAFDEAQKLRSEEDRMRDPHAFTRHVVTGWGEDVVGEDGAPVPFSPDNLDRMLELPWVARRLFDEYVRGLAGDPRLGN